MEDDDADHVLHDEHEHQSEEDPEEDEEDDYLIDTNVLQQHHHQHHEDDDQLQPEEEEATHKNNNGDVIPTEQQQLDDDDDEDDDDDVVDDMMTNPPPYHPHPHPRPDGDGDAPLSHLIKSEHHHEDDTAPPPPEFHYADAAHAHAQMMMVESDESGTEEDRLGFINLLESFCKEHALDFKPPKFYGEPLNCLKLWRAVTRLGGYERVTASKLWRQVGETFNPPKTCTTVSWTFRIFYEKALLEYEKHKRQTGELQFPDPFIPDPVPVESEITGYKTPGAGRARRDSAARAMQGWHSHRGYDYGEDKNQNSTAKREKHLKSIGISPSLMKKKASNMELSHNEADRQLAVTVVDIGPSADWVKINVRETKDCFEVYALVPGLLRDEVRVQSDPVGRLVITGQPEQLENPWGITPFKKVVNLPGRIDPHQTSAVVSLHGRLFVRVPFDQ